MSYLVSEWSFGLWVFCQLNALNWFKLNLGKVVNERLLPTEKIASNPTVKTKIVRMSRAMIESK